MISELNTATLSSKEPQTTPVALKPWHRPELVVMPVKSRTNISYFAGSDGNGPTSAS